MRIVAIGASLLFLHRVMFEGCSLGALDHLFVAICAEIIPRFYEDKFEIGTVGIVTLFAIRFYNDTMGACSFFRQDLFMTTITEIACLCD